MQALRDIAVDDMDHGDFVTLDRVDRGFVVYEHILTFSGIIIKRGLLKYACYAPAEKSQEDL